MKTLILVRHAHRDKLEGKEQDNGLSQKGQAQALAIERLYRKLYPATEPLLASSPKQRCVETLMPLAEKLDLDLEIMKLLSEGDSLKKKTQKFFEWWQQEAPAIVVACSHGDWIPEFLDLATGARITCAKGSWCEMGESLIKPRLVTLIQEPSVYV
jgi:8-oxo-(d)GTP phosphatase